jgi:hypothetical protein
MDDILNIKGLSIQDKIDLNNGIKFIKVPTEELNKQRVDTYSYLI